MCRFVLYLGEPLLLSELLVAPAHSLIRQSFASKERKEPLNGDGFGVAWYVPELRQEPAVFRSISPAWSNQNLRSLAGVTKSPCVLAHVRAASPGLAVSETNCHPFRSGHYAFMHNGRIDAFLRVKRRVQALLDDTSYAAVGGSTDSEHVFALFLHHLRAQPEGLAPLAAMAAALRQAIADIDALTRPFRPALSNYLNLCVSDGVRAVVSRYQADVPEQAESLFVHAGARYRCVDGVCQMQPASADDAAVLVSSEPLSQDPGWQRVPPNHLVLIDADHVPRVEALTLPAASPAALAQAGQ